jgi:dTDP-glucose 4,6-dehydratase
MILKQFNFIQDDLKTLFTNVKSSELDALKNSTVCITGGAGFIGSWLANTIHYLNENFEFQTKVLVVDRDIEKIQKACPHLLNSKYFEFKRTDTRYLMEFPRDVNYIIHAAGSPDTREHLSQPIDVMSTIANGTEAVLRSAERLSDLRMFLNLSSSLVYGSFSETNKNTSENDFYKPSSQPNFYSEAKKYSEVLTDAFRQQFRLPVVTMRPFGFMGPYQALSGPWAVNTFINDAINGHTIKILGDGNTIRSLLYGSDAAFWILKTLVNAESGSKYNLGSSEAVALKDLAHKVQTNLKNNKDILFYAGSSSVGKTSFMVPDTTQIQNKFNLKITVPLDIALKRTIEWYSLSK